MRGEGLKRARPCVCVQNISDYSIPLIIGLGGSCRIDECAKGVGWGFCNSQSCLEFANAKSSSHLFLKDLVMLAGSIKSNFTF